MSNQDAVVTDRKSVSMCIATNLFDGLEQTENLVSDKQVSRVGKFSWTLSSGLFGLDLV